MCGCLASSLHRKTFETATHLVSEFPRGRVPMVWRTYGLKSRYRLIELSSPPLLSMPGFVRSPLTSLFHKTGSFLAAGALPRAGAHLLLVLRCIGPGGRAQGSPTTHPLLLTRRGISPQLPTPTRQRTRTKLCSADL